MIDDNAMDTSSSSGNVLNVDRYRIANESDQQWFHRKQFIEAFRFDYQEERLLCLAQCYANMKSFGCKYSEPLKSLLDQLAEKLSNSAIKRPTSDDATETNNKRNASTVSSISGMNSFLTDIPNFVSFSSANPPPKISGNSQPIKSSSVDPKSIFSESTENKYIRLRTFANQLKHSMTEAQNRTGHDESDHAIEHIYQVGSQQRLFVDYRPDNSNDSSRSNPMPVIPFQIQTFYGKLFIDEIYICSGQGTNKKLCKRNCFQEALNRFLSDNFDVKLVVNKDGRQQYELTAKLTQEEEQQDAETFFIPPQHPMAKSKLNFVHARDTSTIATRTARQQSQLEQQYWHQWGRGAPLVTRPRRIQRSFSPPPPVPHQPMQDSTNVTIEAVSTTPVSVSMIINGIEQAAHQQMQIDTKPTGLNYPFQTRTGTGHVSNTTLSTEPIPSKQEPINPAAKNNAMDPLLFTQQRAKLSKMQAFLFSLSNSLADPSQSIDLISTHTNKYQLNVEFECADKPTNNGFHGHLIVEQIEIADGYGINKKLAKKQTYAHALKSIAAAKSYSLELRDETRWILVYHNDDKGIVQVPPARRLPTARSDERPTRWGPPTAVSAVTHSNTSAVRHYHERRVEEGLQREREPHPTNGVCIPPPALIEPPLARADISKDLSKCTSSTDETIVHNIRRLIPNTFVLFELFDFDSNIPGHYVSMLFTSMSKNKLELKYEFTHVPTGCMVTYTIDNRFFMSWVAPTKVAAKQMGAKKAIEMLKTIYPSIKTKQGVGDMSMNDNEVTGITRKIITRTQLYQQSTFVAQMMDSNPPAPPKEDMGMKLLKKMGWVGGGIGKDLQGIAEPIQIEDLQGRKGLGSNSLYPDQIFVRNLRRILEEFIATNTDDEELQFASEFNSEERKAIHKEAMRLHLTSNSYGRDGERRIRITQKRNVDQLVDHLLTHGGETARYELKTQIQPRSKVTTSVHPRAYNQTAPPKFQWAAPDACDDGTL